MPVLDPRFIAAPAGRLFCLNVLPEGAPRGYVFHLPAFAEEMNKARHMSMLAALALARNGWQVIIVDPLGTGDSEHDFSAASWDRWVADTVWCRQNLAGIDPTLPWLWWGTRSGALLASAACQLAGGDGLVLWQPVTAGAQFLTQFLRLKLANESLAGHAAGGMDTKPLRAQLKAGEALEIGGYMLASALASGLEAATLTPPAGVPLAWLEVSARETPDLLPASQRVVDALRTAGHVLDARAVSGAAYWQSLEISEVPALVEATVDAAARLCRSECAA